MKLHTHVQHAQQLMPYAHAQETAAILISPRNITPNKAAPLVHELYVYVIRPVTGANFTKVLNGFDLNGLFIMFSR